MGVELPLRHALIPLGRSRAETFAPNHHGDSRQEDNCRYDSTDDEYRGKASAFDPFGQ